MLTASQVYTYTRRILDAYTVVMQPLSAELDMAPNAVDILLFLANNPGLDTARDICTYRRLKPGIVSFHVDKLVREGICCAHATPATGGAAASCARTRPRPSSRAGRPCRSSSARRCPRASRPTRSRRSSAA